MYMAQAMPFIDANQIDALLWFWLPLALIPIGFWLMLERERKLLRNIGPTISLLGIILVMASQWTVPESDSSASGQLLLSVVGPVILLVIGSFLAIFGGPVPVGRLPGVAKPAGYVSIALGLSWLLSMHMISSPIWRDEVNPYWKVWWAVFLISMCLISMILVQLLLIFGENRQRAAFEITLFGLGSGVAFFMLMFNDGAQVTAAEMRSQIWFATADIIGTIVGILLAIFAFAMVITLYERSLPSIEPTEPLNEEEKHRVREILSNNLGGENNV